MIDQQQLPPGVTISNKDPIDEMVDKGRALAGNITETSLEPTLFAVLRELYTKTEKCNEAAPILQQLAGALSQFRYGLRDETKRANDEKARADVAEAELARIRGAQVIDAVASEIGTNGTAEPTQFRTKKA